MGLVIFGTKQTPIGFDEMFVKCPACECSNRADVMVISNFYHLYWIPMFPIEKQADIVCQKCGLKRYGLPFDPNIINNYHEVKGKFSHPFYTYAGIAFFSVMFIGVLIASVV